MKSLELTAGDDPDECVGAAVQSECGRFVVYLLRADGQAVAVNCESAASTADLVLAMNPPNVAELLAELRSGQATTLP